jgi:acyl dehydratase
MSKLDEIKVGDELETCVVESVDPARLKTMAALYDDPNPIHFDLAATRELGRAPPTSPSCWSRRSAWPATRRRSAATR